MRHEPIGHTTLPLSALALATEPTLAEPQAWGTVDDNERVDAIRLAIDEGINLIDTSALHGQGHGEVIVGRAVRERRDQVLIATKGGAVLDETTGRPRRCLAGPEIERECEASLRRLGTDTIDLYQCHWPDPDTPIRETMETLCTLLETGKIRSIGLCNFGCQRIAAAREYGPVHAVQVPFSLLNRRATTDLLPYCAECGIAVLARDPVASGLLTDLGGPRDATGGKPVREPDIMLPGGTEYLSLAEKIRTIATSCGKSVGQLAIHWAARQPGITTVMVSAVRPSLVREARGALGWELDPDLAAELDARVPNP